ncbi:MAG: glycosyltransferase family 2 protein [Acidimicrobiia bacterium]
MMRAGRAMFLDARQRSPVHPASLLALPQAPQGPNGQVEVSVVLPCLNEAAGIGFCVEEASTALAGMGMSGEILVVDNGSIDGSPEIAASLGARVVLEPKRGYGNAYLRGLAEAQGRYLVMGDADATYDLSALPRFVRALQDGADLVMGTRLKGEIARGAMPWLHRHVGNPVLTAIVNLRFGTGLSDIHCGMRSLTRDAYHRLRLRSPGMEFASELIIEAAREGLAIEEIPIEYRRRRGGQPKLRTWRDGWRHLRLILSRRPSGRTAPKEAALPASLGEHA